jgi:hypothetical protein
MRRFRSTGATLVDALVGIILALLAIVAAHRTLVILGDLRRSASATAEAEQTSRLAIHVLATAAGNAGNGLAAAARWLDTCPASSDVARSLRPITLLVIDGGASDRPDGIVVRQTLQSRIAAAAAFAQPATAEAPFRVLSPGGFKIGDRVAAISRSGSCAMAVVSAVNIVSPGVTEIAHSDVGVDLPITSLLVDLGPAPQAWVTRFDVAAGTLRSTDLANGDAPSPLTSNVVNLKFQYGIDRDGDGTLDDWIRADSTNGLDAAAILAAPSTALDRIVALRIGIVARSDAFDPQARGPFRWTLFDCALADKSGCPGRLEGTVADTATGGYRYAVQEAIVPLRNTLWNRNS